ncbi:hypothetical protein BGZ76_002626 [Entomortierella beljakovae]|nr:hypothetical protein BGZ76_002626 [Entomortierella beljakovae]
MQDIDSEENTHQKTIPRKRDLNSGYVGTTSENLLPSSEVSKWYLKKSDNVLLECTKDEQPPVKFNVADKHIDFSVKNEDLTSIEYEICDIVLRISANPWLANCMKSITLNLYEDHDRQIILAQWFTMIDQDAMSSCWRLHQSFSVRRDDGSFLFRLEIATHSDEINSTDVGSTLEINHIQCHRIQHENQDSTKPIGTTSNKEVVCYSMSQNGNFAATLCKDETNLYLELWTDPVLVGNRKKVPRSISIPLKGTPMNLFISVSWDGKQISVMDSSIGEPSPSPAENEIQNNTPDTDSQTDAPSNWFQVYNWEEMDKSNKLELSKCLRNLNQDEQAKIKGFGKFYIPTDNNVPDFNNELFILCGGNTVEIYSVQGRWEHIRSIKLSNLDITNDKYLEIASRSMINGICSQYFPRIYHKENIVSIWDISTGAVVSYVTIMNPPQNGDIPICISSDGNIIAIVDGHILRTYQTSTGSILGSIEMPCHAINSIVFVNNDSQIVAFTNGSSTMHGIFRYGCVLETANLTVSHWVLCSGNILKHPMLNAGGTLCYVQSVEFKTKGIVSQKKFNNQNYSKQPQILCSLSQCEGKLTPICKAAEIAFTSTSGCKFTAKIDKRISKAVHSTNKAASFAAKLPLLSQRNITTQAKHNKEAPHIVVTASNMHEFVIPPIYKSQGSLDEFRHVMCLEAHSSLVITSESTIMIWKFADDTDGKFILQLVWTFDGDTILDDDMEMCNHQQLCCHTKMKEQQTNEKPTEKDYEQVDSTESAGYQRTFYPRVNRVAYMEHKAEFNNGILTLSKMFKEADNTFKEAALQYFDSNINNSCLPELFSQKISSGHELFVEFVVAYLQLPSTKWVPPVILNPDLNPVLGAVKKATRSPEKIEIVENMINQFIERGKQELDPHIVMTVTQCLSDLSRGSSPHTGLMKRTLRRLAFFPVKSRQFVLKNYSVVPPPRFNWRHLIWTEKMTINVSKDPILQLSFNSEPKRIQYLGYLLAALVVIFFTILGTILFPFVLIFSPKDAKIFLFVIVSGPVVIIGFILVPVIIIIGAILFPIISVISTAFNKPAIRKGYVQFLKDCYLILQEIAVLLLFEAYQDDVPKVVKENKPFISDLYVATFEMLWTNYGKEGFGSLPVAPAEFTIPPSMYWFKSLFHLLIYKFNPHTPTTVECHNFSIDMLDNPAIRALVEYKWSTYNLIDIVTFTSALVGSIDQLKRKAEDRGCPEILSFTLIFAALQFMFELRVNRGVSFSTAILHLLKSTPIGSTETVNSADFPKHYYKAAGRYDPISDLFNDPNPAEPQPKDNWMFLTMMILNFSFAGIIILNMLIALINVAFSKGDETWQQVWLENKMFIIEAAENMTYHIPDYRKYYSCWFPREIYYSVRDRDTMSKYEKETNELINEANTFLREWLDTSSYPKYQRPQSNKEDHPDETIQDLREKNGKLESKLDDMQSNINILQSNINGLQSQMTEMLTLLKEKR